MTHEHVYALPPIDDFVGMGWTTADGDIGRGDLRDAIERALAVIETHPFYEDTGDAYFMALPTTENVNQRTPRQYAVAVKIQNNGTTFVWSPCELPWLADYEGLGPEAVAALGLAVTDLDEWRMRQMWLGGVAQ